MAKYSRRIQNSRLHGVHDEIHQSFCLRVAKEKRSALASLQWWRYRFGQTDKAEFCKAALAQIKVVYILD